MKSVFNIRVRSTVSYAGGLFITEDVESNEPYVFRLGVYQFPENTFQLRYQRITREMPFSSRLLLLRGSLKAWVNERLGYTLSVLLSGRLVPFRSMEGREDHAYNVFSFVYRAFAPLDPTWMMTYDKLFDPVRWFRSV